MRGWPAKSSQTHVKCSAATVFCLSIISLVTMPISRRCLHTRGRILSSRLLLDAVLRGYRRFRRVRCDFYCMVAFKLVQPFLIKMGIITPEEADQRYEQMLREMMLDD